MVLGRMTHAGNSGRRFSNNADGVVLLLLTWTRIADDEVGTFGGVEWRIGFFIVL